MQWRFNATRAGDGVTASGTVEADTMEVARLRALDAALDALGHAELSVSVSPVIPEFSFRTDANAHYHLVDTPWDLDC